MRSHFRVWVILTMAVMVVVGSGCSKRGKIDRLIARGDKAVAAGNVTEGEELYLQAVILQPGDPEAMGRLGMICYNDGRVVQGYSFLEHALASLPDNRDFRLHFALASFTLGRTIDARNSAKQVLESAPREELALLVLVETCVTSRDNEEARKIVEDLRTKHGDAACYHVALGALRRLQRDLAGAEVEIKKAIELDPNSSAARAQYAEIFLTRRDNAKATESLKKAVELAPVRSPIRLKYIEHLIRTGALDEARKVVTATVAAAPELIPALTYDMDFAFREGRLEDSEAIAKKILRRDRTNYEALIRMASIKLQKNDLDGVIADLQTAEGFYERAPQIKYELASMFMRKGELYRAEESLSKALAIAPTYEDALLLLGELHILRGNPNGAVGVLEPLVKRNPQVRRTQVMLAQAYKNRGDDAAGLAILRALVEKSPDVPDNHYLVGLALAGRDNRMSRQAFEATVKLAENHWAAQEMLLDDDLTAKRTADALRRAEGLIAKYPTATGPWLFRAKVRLAGGDLPGAESDLQKVLELDSNVQVAYLLLARIHFQRNRADEAVTTLVRSTEKSPSAGTLTQLGMLYSALQKNESARDAYEKALAIDANFTPALNNLAALYAEKLGEQEKALRLARKAGERAPGDPFIADTLGWILFLHGQYQTALPLLQSSAEKLPGMPSVLQHLAATYYYLGQEDAARRTFERVIASDAEAATKQDAQNRLAIMAVDPDQPDAASRELLARQIAREPNDVAALTRLGILEARAGEDAKAAAHLEAALKVDARSVRSMVTLVDLYLGSQSNPERARELAAKARSTAPNDGQVAWRLGISARRTGDFAWVAQLLQDAVRNLPNNAEVRFDFARALYESGRAADAETHLQALAKEKISPATQEQVRRMNLLLGSLKRPADLPGALQEARKFLAEEPDYLPALMVVAADLEQKQAHGEARDVYEKILERNAAFAPATRQLALLYGEQLGDDTKAEALALKARQVFTDDASLAFVLGSVSYRRGDYPAAVRFFRQSLRQRDDHAQSTFFVGMSLYYMKNYVESRTNLERALTLKLSPQETSEAERVLEELGRNRLVR